MISIIKNVASLYKRLILGLSHFYMQLSYKLYFLPRHPTITQYESIGADRDDSEYFDIAPARDHEVKLHAVWFADVITPSVAQVVSQKIGSINWRAPGSHDTSDQWMKGTRRIGAGGWRNLGSITRKRSWWPYGTIMKDLPDDFSSASLALISITPSLSALVGCFYVTDERLSQYDDVAKLPMWGEAVPAGGGRISVLEPRARKEKLLLRLRAARRRDVARFFAKNFGTFFSENSPDALPMVDFLEFTQCEGPLSRFVLGHGTLWKSNRSIIHLQHPLGFDEDERISAYYLSKDIGDLDLSFYGGNDARGLLGSLSRSLGSNWAIEATFALVKYYENMLSGMRDQAFVPIVGFRSKRAFARMERIREMADIPIIMSEVANDDMLLPTTTMLNFTQTEFQDRDESLNSGYQANLKRRAKLILSNYRGVVDVN